MTFWWYLEQGHIIFKILVAHRTVAGNSHHLPCPIIIIHRSEFWYAFITKLPASGTISKHMCEIEEDASPSNPYNTLVVYITYPFGTTIPENNRTCVSVHVCLRRRRPVKYFRILILNYAEFTVGFKIAAQRCTLEVFLEEFFVQ